jgi:hypothetical protein
VSKRSSIEEILMAHGIFTKPHLLALASVDMVQVIVPKVQDPLILL